MDIETVLVDIGHAEKEQAAIVDTLNSYVETITDPNFGQNINLLE